MPVLQESGRPDSLLEVIARCAQQAPPPYLVSLHSRASAVVVGGKLAGLLGQSQRA